MKQMYFIVRVEIMTVSTFLISSYANLICICESIGAVSVKICTKS